MTLNSTELLLRSFQQNAASGNVDNNCKLTDEELSILAETQDIASLAARLQARGVSDSKDSALSAALDARVHYSLPNSHLLRTPLKLEEIAKQLAMQEFDGKNAEDQYLGISAATGKFNSNLSIQSHVNKNKEALKQKQKQLSLLKQWEKAARPVPAPRRIHENQGHELLRDLILENFDLSIGRHKLLEESELRLIGGKKYGLIGRNGIGKTTLISFLARKEDSRISKTLNIACVEQHCDKFLDLTPLQCLLEVDQERSYLLRDEQKLKSLAEKDDAAALQLSAIYDRLSEIQADRAESEALTLLHGLGLSEHQCRNVCLQRVNGGNRMRVMLARALFAKPDLLLLDEPTNHLDIHAVAWLAHYLRNAENTCVIVSHCRHFLDEVCTNIIEFSNKKLNYYTGNYNDFEHIFARRKLEHNRRVESQNRTVAHIQKFIDKNRYNCEAAQVQSRIKYLNKLELLEEIADDPTLQFSFVSVEKLPSPYILAQDISFGFPGCACALLENVNLMIDSESRMVICGVNGCGKSTLLKLLTGDLKPCKGLIHKQNSLKIGFFSQHHVDTLDLTLSAVAQLIELNPKAQLTENIARGFLARFGVTGTMAMEPMFILSGGQRSRIIFALIAFAEPHMLILDEPTNHLDFEAIQAMIIAINDFNGPVLIVSHDAHLLNCVADEIYYVDPQSHAVIKYKGSFDEYYKQVRQYKI